MSESCSGTCQLGSGIGELDFAGLLTVESVCPLVARAQGGVCHHFHWLVSLVLSHVAWKILRDSEPRAASAKARSSRAGRGGAQWPMFDLLAPEGQK